MTKYKQAIDDYMKAKNKIGKRLFGYEFAEEKEVKVLLQDISESGTKDIVEVIASQHSMGYINPAKVCPHCIHYKSCQDCPLNSRTKGCEAHPIISGRRYWSTVSYELEEDSEFRAEISKLNDVLNEELQKGK